MNPYQKTVEEMKRQNEGPKRFAKTVASVGTAAGAASFAPVLARAAPFLSQYIPEDLAVKGLSKISPKFGNFIKSAIDSGYDINQVKDFIGQQVTESQTAAKDDRSVIEQYSPELHQFIDQEVKKGRSPIEAAAIAQNDKKFKDIINKLTKDHKAPWSSIVESIFGGKGQAQPQQTGQTQQNQGSQLDDTALMDAFSKILKM